MNISLPDSMKEFVDLQVSEGGYETASEYVRHLLREERKRRTREQVDAQLLEGLASGEPVKADERFWRGLKRQVLRGSRRKRSR